MGSHGIKDKVAIVGMGCTTFAEHWDQGADDLTVRRTTTQPVRSIKGQRPRSAAPSVS